MPFDIAKARAAKKSDTQIADYLGKTYGFDVAKARASGKTDTQIAEYLSKNDKPGTKPVAPVEPQESPKAKAQATADTNSAMLGLTDRLSGVEKPAESLDVAGLQDPFARVTNPNLPDPNAVDAQNKQVLKTKGFSAASADARKAMPERKETLAKQFDAEWNKQMSSAKNGEGIKERTKSDVWTDAAKQFTGGLVSTAAGISWLADKVPGIDSEDLTAHLSGFSDYLGEIQSDQARAEAKSLENAKTAGETFETLISNPLLISKVVLESMPIVIPGMGLAAVSAKAAFSLGVKKALAKGATKEAAILAGRAAAVTAASVAGKGSEAMLSGGMSGNDTQRAVMKMPEWKLEAVSERYRELTLTMTPLEARKQLAGEVSVATAIASGTATAVGGAFAAKLNKMAGLGDTYAAQLIRNAQASKVVKEFGGETTEEVSQSFLEQIAGNVTNVDDTTGTFDEVGKSVVMGATGAIGQTAATQSLGAASRGLIPPAPTGGPTPPAGGPTPAPAAGQPPIVPPAPAPTGGPAPAGAPAPTGGPVPAPTGAGAPAPVPAATGGVPSAVELQAIADAETANSRQSAGLADEERAAGNTELADRYEQESGAAAARAKAALDTIQTEHTGLQGIVNRNPDISAAAEGIDAAAAAANAASIEQEAIALNAQQAAEEQKNKRIPLSNAEVRAGQLDAGNRAALGLDQLRDDEELQPVVPATATPATPATESQKAYDGTTPIADIKTATVTELRKRMGNVRGGAKASSDPDFKAKALAEYKQIAAEIDRRNAAATATPATPAAVDAPATPATEDMPAAEVKPSSTGVSYPNRKLSMDIAKSDENEPYNTVALANVALANMQPGDKVPVGGGLVVKSVGNKAITFTKPDGKTVRFDIDSPRFEQLIRDVDGAISAHSVTQGRQSAEGIWEALKRDPAFSQDEQGIPQLIDKKPQAATAKPKDKAPAPQVSGAPTDVVLQNRDRSTPALVTQMNKIAANPSPIKAGFSRDFANGAPVITQDTAVIPENQMGNKSVVVTAGDRKIEIQYAVIEAADLLTSHAVDGTANEGYQTGLPGKARTIAGNGRGAGIKAGFKRGSTDAYVEGTANDESLHGVSAEVIRGMKEPILVRIMQPKDITANIGDESNQGGIADKDPLTHAKDDSRRINVADIEFGEDGHLTRSAIMQFVLGMPASESAGLIGRDGEPITTAKTRLMNAVFWSAYGSEALTELYAQATDPEARVIMNALAIAGTEMVQLGNLGEDHPLDIRRLVAEAAEAVINAKRQGITLANYIEQGDLALDANVLPILRMFNENSRSAKKIAEKLKEAATFVLVSVANSNDGGFFDAPPLPNLDDALGKIHETGRKTSVVEQKGPAPNGVNAEQATTNTGGQGNNEQAAEDGQAPIAGTDAFSLDAQTEGDIAAKEAREQQDTAKADEKKRIDATADAFSLSTGTVSTSDQMKPAVSGGGAGLFDQTRGDAKKDAKAANLIAIDAELGDALDDLADLMNQAGRPGQLNSGIDPVLMGKILGAGLKVSGILLKKGAVKFSIWAENMIAALKSKGVDESLTKQILKKVYLASKADADRDIRSQMDSEDTVLDYDLDSIASPKVDSPAGESSSDAGLSGRLYDLITAGNMPKDNAELKKWLRDVDGAEPSQSRMKFAQEELEAAIVLRSRDIVSEGKSEQETFAALLALYNSQPNLNIRSSTSVENQAYSTPAPLAYLAAIAADVGSDTLVYEPTAGNGMLLITASPQNATANELEENRYKSLVAQGFSAISGDALQAIESGAVLKNSQDAVVTNPPFGSIKDEDGRPKKVIVDGFRLGKIDHLIAADALRALKDDGKATLIIGADKVAGGISTDDRIFFNWLYSNYNVTSHFELDGKLYARQGAGWPVRFITIDGRKQSSRVSPAPDTIKRFNTWESVYEQFKALGTENGSEGVAVGTGSNGTQVTGNDTGTAPAATRVQAGRASTSSRTGRTGSSSRASTIPAGNASAPLGERNNVLGSDGRSTSENQLGQGEQGRVNSGTSSEGVAGRTKPSIPAGDAVSTSENKFQSFYVPRSSRKDKDILIPVNMQQPLQDALSVIEDDVGDIDEFVRSELGYETTEQLHDALMGLQVDSVAAAIYQIRKNKAIVIADQTGIGKGRQAASIIRWAKRQGRIPVFVSAKPQLFTDMFDELNNIGSNDITPFLMNSDASISSATGEKLFSNKGGHKATLQSIADSGSLPDGKNAIFMTYSQISTNNVQRTALDSIAQNAIFILDESHNAGGESATGQFFRGVLANAAGVTYLSATYAKRPDNMPLYFKTDIGDALGDDNALMDAMERGGLALQTVVSNNLVKAGQMFRRERSYDGVSITTVADVDRRIEHEKLSDSATEVLRHIVDADRKFHSIFFEAEQQRAKAEGEDIGGAGNNAAAQVDHTEFSSVVHNFVRQMLLGLKANAAADEAIASLKRGEKPLIAVENTMGSFLSEYAASNGIKTGDALGDFSYRTVMSRALERTRYIKRKLANGDEVRDYITLDQLDPVTREAYDAAQDLIENLDIDIPASPIDWIRNRIIKAGFSVMEITGRDLSVDYSGASTKLSRIDNAEQTDKVRTTRMFNNGSLDAIILNVAGSTGISLHSSENVKDQRQRHMIVAQAAQDINIFMQMLGRVHRTGQVNLPKYTILNVDLPAEKRPTAVLSGKMKSLNANTSSNTESATSVKAGDILNKYGDRVVADYLAENTSLALALNIPIGSSDKDNEKADLARKVTGRMALMPVSLQKQFYDDVESQYSDLIEYLNKTNQNDLEPRTFDFDARELKSIVIVPESDSSTPFGLEAVYNEISIKAQGRPMSPDEIRESIKENLDGNTEFAHMKNLISGLEEKYATFALSLGDESSITAANVRGRGTDLIRTLPIGTTMRMEINGEQYNGVVTNIRSNHKGNGNPFSLSKIQVTVALNGSLRSLTIPGTQIDAAVTGYVRMDLDQAFRQRPADEREVAKVITGNLLAAYGEVAGTSGTIINFTKADGSVEQGILLPKSFNPKANLRSDYRVKTGADALKVLHSRIENMGRFGISSRDSVVRITPARDGGIIITVPKSKAKGGKYFLDKVILKEAGDFFSKGNNMVVSVSASNAAAAINAVMAKQALYTLPSMSNEARELLGEPAIQQIDGGNTQSGGSDGKVDEKYPATYSNALVNGQYSVNEREASNIQSQKRAARSIQSTSNDAGRSAQPDLFGESAASAGPDAARLQSSADFAIQVESEITRTVKVSTNTILDASDAAEVFFPFRNRAQETFLVAMVDSRGRVTEVLQHSIGKTAEASVELMPILGAAAKNPSTESVWLAHNHPSGKTTPSNSDVSITKILGSRLGDIGIKLSGHVILGNSDFSELDSNGLIESTNRPYREDSAARTISISERNIVRHDAYKGVIGSPSEAKRIAQEYNEDGILLLSQQHDIIGFLAVTPEEMRFLRPNNGKGARRIAAAVEGANAAAAIIITKTKDKHAAYNIGNMLARLGTRTLDHIAADTGDSAAELGNDNWSADNLMFSSGGKEGAAAKGKNTKAAVQAIVSPITAKWKSGITAIVVQSVSDLPIGSVPGDVEGLYLGDGVAYLIADNLPNEDRVLEVLAHEAIGHAAMEEMLGNDLMEELTKEIGAWIKNKSGVFVALSNEVNKRQPGLSPRVHAKEIIALMAERGMHRKGNIWNRVVGAVRAWLRSIGMPVKWLSTLSGPDLFKMLADAEKYVKNGDGPNPGARSSTNEAYASKDALFSVFGFDAEYSPEEISFMQDLGLLTQEEAETMQVVSLNKEASNESNDVLRGNPEGAGRRGNQAGIVSGGAKARQRQTRIENSPLLGRMRKISDRAATELRGEAETERTVDSPLGFFSGYVVRSEQIEPDSMYPDGHLQISVFGKEQIEAGLNDEPALLIVVAKNGELIINGPSSDGDTFKEFQRRGWADFAKDADGNKLGAWTALSNPGGKKLPPRQVIALLADTHARLRTWKQTEKARLHWVRSTGATGGMFDSFDDGRQYDGGRGGNVYFSRPAYDGVGDTYKLPPARNLVIKLFNKFDQIKRVTDAVKEQGGSVDVLSDVFGQEEAFHSRAASYIDRFRRHRLGSIIKRISKAGVKLEDVGIYLYAQHAEERNRQIATFNPGMPDGGSGMPTAEANQILADFQARPDIAKLDTFAKEFRDIIADTRNRLRTSGLESNDSVDAWEAMYSFYIPLAGKNEADNPTMAATGRGYDIRGGQKRALGRKDKARHVIEQIIIQHEAAVIRSEKNVVGKRLLKFVTDNPDNKLWAVNPTEQRRYVNADGEVDFRNAPLRTDKNVVSVRIDGKDTFIFLEDESMARAMKNMGSEDIGVVLRVLGVFSRFISKMFTAFSPAFVLMNAVRDFMAAMIHGYQVGGVGYSAKIAKNMAWAFSQMVQDAWSGDNAAVKLYEQSGGRTGMVHMIKDLQEKHEEVASQMAALNGVSISEIMDAFSVGFKEGRAALARKARYNIFTKPFDALFSLIESVNGVVENTTRLAAFQAAIETGKTVREAGSIAKNLTVNFNRKGEYAAGLGAAYIFFNASVQGSARMYEALKDRRLQAVAGGMALLSFAIAALQMDDDDDEDKDGRPDFEQVPAWQRSRNIIIMQKGGGYIKIPLPLGWNAFHMIGTELAVMTRSKNKESYAEGLGNIVMQAMGVFNPVGDFVPSVAAPFVEIMRNKSHFGSKIYPDYKDKLPNSQQFYDGTEGNVYERATSAANKTTGGNEFRGGWLDINPEKLQHIVEFFGGGALKFITDTADTVTAMSDGGPKKEADKIPIAKAFYGKIRPEYQTTRYYDNKDKVLAVKREIDGLKDAQQPEEAAKVLAKNPWVDGLSDMMKPIDKDMKKLKADERAIRADDKLSAGERRKELEAVRVRRGNLVKDFNAQYEFELRKK